MINIFNKIAETSSTKEKVEIISSNSNNELFKKILYYMYSPYNNYHVKKYKVSTSTPTNKEFDDRLFELLDKLKAREFTGNTALNVIDSTLSQYHEDVQVIFDRILKHDARCGVSTSLINKAIPSLIPVVPYQRCGEYNEKAIEKIKKELEENFEIYVQKKEDGSFWYLNLNENTFISRSGNVFDSLGFFDNTEKETLILIGELLVVDKKTFIPLAREIGNGIINSIYQENDISVCPEEYMLQYVYWDSITPEEYLKGETDVPYNKRLERFNHTKYLDKNIKFIETFCAYDEEDIDRLYEKFIKQNDEGVVIKFIKSLWKNGTAKDVFKRKRFVELDLKVVSFNEGTGKYAGKLGSINFSSSDEMLEVSVSGFSDEQREKIWNDKDTYINTIWTIKANDLLKSSDKEKYSLFLPCIVEQRFDKTEADSIEKIKEIFNE